MFKFIDHPDIPKTSNALESFFGHLKDNLRVHRGLSFEHQQATVLRSFKGKRKVAHRYL